MGWSKSNLVELDGDRAELMGAPATKGPGGTLKSLAAKLGYFTFAIAFIAFLRLPPGCVVMVSRVAGETLARRSRAPQSIVTQDARGHDPRASTDAHRDSGPRSWSAAQPLKLNTPVSVTARSLPWRWMPIRS